MAVHNVDISLLNPMRPLFVHMVDSMFPFVYSARITQSCALVITLLSEIWFAMVWWHCARSTCKVPIQNEQLAALCGMCSLLTHPFVWLWADVFFSAADESVRIWFVELVVLLTEGAILCWFFLPGRHLRFTNSVSLLMLSAGMNGTSF